MGAFKFETLYIDGHGCYRNGDGWSMAHWTTLSRVAPCHPPIDIEFRTSKSWLWFDRILAVLHVHFVDSWMNLYIWLQNVSLQSQLKRSLLLHNVSNRWWRKQVYLRSNLHKNLTRYLIQCSISNQEKQRDRKQVLDGHSVEWVWLGWHLSVVFHWLLGEKFYTFRGLFEAEEKKMV